MSHKVDNGMMMWKGNGNTTTLLLSLKGLAILQRDRGGQVNTIMMEHLNSILLHKSGPANKQHTNIDVNVHFTSTFNQLSLIEKLMLKPKIKVKFDCIRKDDNHCYSKGKQKS